MTPEQIRYLAVALCGFLFMAPDAQSWISVLAHFVAGIGIGALFTTTFLKARRL